MGEYFSATFRLVSGFPIDWQLVARKLKTFAGVPLALCSGVGNYAEVCEGISNIPQPIMARVVLSAILLASRLS